MKGRILILGAGVYQIPAIKKAREMGLKSVVASHNIASYPGYKFADFPVEADTTDIEKIIRIAKKYQVQGIFTTGTDVALKALGKVNSELGLVGPSLEACILSTDKSLMKQAFLDNNIPTANFKIVSNEEDGLSVSNKLGFPVMVKAVNSSGSRGISKVSNEREFFAGWTYAKKYSKDDDPIIIEEYLEGIEFGAQAFIYDGKVHLVCLHNDTVTPAPYSTPIGHSYPFKELSVQEEAEEVVKKGVTALKIDNSAANIDLIKTKKGVKVLEIGARMGATCLPELTSIFTGIDIYAECIKMAIGKKPNFQIQEQKPVAGLLLRASETGVISNILLPDEGGDFKLRLDIQEGGKVSTFKIGPDRIGDIVVMASDYKEAENVALKLSAQVKIDLIKS